MKIVTFLQILNRRNELRRLVTWASRKRLSMPLRLYHIRLTDEERWLFRYRINAPWKLLAARIIFRFKQMITPSLRYIPKGSAKAYRVSRLTHHIKSHNILNN